MVVYCSSSCTLWTIFLCLQSARRLSLYFLLTVGDRIYHADHGTCADYAQFCGGTPQQNRPVDPDCTGICGKSSIGKISRNGFCIYHRYGDHCNHTIAVNVLRNDPIRGILCSSAWILAVWLRLHCRWYVYFLIDRKPGDFRSFDICCIICRLYDGKHLQSDLRERKSSDKNFRLLRSLHAAR